MLAPRIIPCLDVKDGVVVKGVRFRDHKVLGDILDLALRYRDEGADELVFYDITASVENRVVDTRWVREIARFLDIPFCVAGGIKTVDDARAVLNAGADKISINTPAHLNPDLINALAAAFGSQCVVVGVDSKRSADGRFICWTHTGDEATATSSEKETLKWVVEAQARGAGEIVLNAMGSDGTGAGYDLEQIQAVRKLISIPLVASGGAGAISHFDDVFRLGQVEGALAAGVFHRGEIAIADLKQDLINNGIEMRPTW